MIGADTLAFISEGGLREAIGGAGLCGACFTGDYPAGVPLLNDVDKLALEG